MYNIEIKVNIKTLTHYSASLQRKVGKETILLMIESFSRYLLELFGRMIEESINSNRYKSNWEPIEEKGYIDYIGTTPTVPMIYLLREYLEVKRIGYNYIIRINTRILYPNSKLKLLTVIRAIEEGTSEFNSRPILKTITRKIQHNILNLWRGYITMKGVV